MSFFSLSFIDSIEKRILLQACNQKYQNEVNSKGWEPKLSINLVEGVTLVYEKDHRIANITMAKEQEGSIINLVINKKICKKPK